MEERDRRVRAFELLLARLFLIAMYTTLSIQLMDIGKDVKSINEKLSENRAGSISREVGR